MELTMTKATTKTACLIYAEYKKRIKNGVSRSEARLFDGMEIENIIDQPEDEIMESVNELKDVFGVKIYVDGSFELSKEFISYMESKNTNEIKSMLENLGLPVSFISQIIGLFFN